MTHVSLELAQSIDPGLDAKTLEVLEPAGAVARKGSEGSTGPASVEKQLKTLTDQAAELAKRAAKTPRLISLFSTLKEASL